MSDRASKISPVALGLISDPPTIVLTYDLMADQDYEGSWVKKKRRKRKMPLRDFTDRSNVKRYAFNLRQRHSQYLSSVIEVTLEKMLRIIQEIQKGNSVDVSLKIVEKEYSIDPEEDLNKLSPAQLAQRKAVMEETFHKNLLRPGDPGYVYDKVVSFDEVKTEEKEQNDWDEGEEEEEEDEKSEKEKNDDEEKVTVMESEERCEGVDTEIQSQPVSLNKMTEGLENEILESHSLNEKEAKTFSLEKDNEKVKANLDDFFVNERSIEIRNTSLNIFEERNKYDLLLGNDNELISFEIESDSESERVPSEKQTNDSIQKEDKENSEDEPEAVKVNPTDMDVEIDAANDESEKSESSSKEKPPSRTEESIKNQDHIDFSAENKTPPVSEKEISQNLVNSEKSSPDKVSQESQDKIIEEKQPSQENENHEVEITKERPLTPQVKVTTETKPQQKDDTISEPQNWDKELQSMEDSTSNLDEILESIEIEGGDMDEEDEDFWT